MQKLDRTKRTTVPEYVQNMVHLGIHGACPIHKFEILQNVSSDDGLFSLTFHSASEMHLHRNKSANFFNRISVT